MPRPRRIDNFSNYTVDPSGCWLWSGYIPRQHGYGRLSVPLHGTRIAHIAFYVEHRGEYDRSLDLDHTCRVRGCVNPDHLEPVSHGENVRRGLIGHGTGMCRNNLHDITGPDAVRVYSGRRYCMKCKAASNAKARRAYRARQRSTP